MLMKIRYYIHKLSKNSCYRRVIRKQESTKIKNWIVKIKTYEVKDKTTNIFQNKRRGIKYDKK